MMAKARLNEARALLATDSLDMALQAAQQAQQFDPFSSQVNAELGRIYQAQGDFSTAEQAFQQSLSLDPDDPTSQWLVGEYWRARGNYDSAYVHLKATIQLAPENATARNSYAAVLDSLGHSKKSSYHRAYSHYLRGRKLEFVGQLDLALEQFQTAITLTDSNSTFQANQGIIYIKKRMPMEAEIFLTQALEQDSTDITALYGMGLLWNEKGDPHQSLGYLQTVIKLDPQHAHAHYAMAVAYYQLNHKEKMRYHLQKAKAGGVAVNKTFDNL